MKIRILRSIESQENKCNISLNPKSIVAVFIHPDACNCNCDNPYCIRGERKLRLLEVSTSIPQCLLPSEFRRLVKEGYITIIE